MIELGNKVLIAIDKNAETGSDISLYLAKIDVENQEQYICNAFMFKPNVMNLLRIINNGIFMVLVIE